MKNKALTVICLLASLGAAVARAQTNAHATQRFVLAKVAEVRTNLQEQINALSTSGCLTGSVSSASSADTALYVVDPSTNWLVGVNGGTATLWRVSQIAGNWRLQCDDLVGIDVVLGGLSFPCETYLNESLGYPGAWLYVERAGPAIYDIYMSTVGYADYWSASWVEAVSPITLTPDHGTQAQHPAIMTYEPATSTNAVGTYVTASDLAAALAAYNTAAATNALVIASNALALAQAAVTQTQLASATNAIVQLYFISTNAWLTADFSNQTFSVSMVSTNGTTNTVTLGEASESIDPEATNLLWQALSVGLATRAPLAWGEYAPDGTINPEPEYMTWLNAPATVYASGCAWSTYGTYAVLVSTGTVAFAAGSNGVFRVGPDSTNWFGYVEGGSVTVGAVPDSITVTGGGTETGYAEIVYDYDGGDFPSVWFAASLAVDFTEVSPLWVDNLDGTATATVPATTAAGFWRATTSASFDRYFQCTMPALFTAGVTCGTNALPVVFDSVIQIETGGHTYRVPAQFVE